MLKYRGWKCLGCEENTTHGSGYCQKCRTKKCKMCGKVITITLNMDDHCTSCRKKIDRKNTFYRSVERI